MLPYLFKTIICSAAFYALYALFFQREKMLVFNRAYLLAGLVVPFFIPFMIITMKATANGPGQVYKGLPVLTDDVPVRDSGSFGLDYISYAAVIIFVLISGYLFFRFWSNYLKLKRVGKAGKHFYMDGIRVVLTNGQISPHSFLNTIFLNKTEYETGRIEAAVLEHELAHIRQRHSWDIVFVELLQIFTWFNPMIYLYKRSIKINHELLADAAVVKRLDNVRGYQHILLQRAFAQNPLALASSFHFFITKKRLIMLQKTFNKKRAFLFSTLAVPILAVLIYSFGKREYVYVNNMANGGDTSSVISMTATKIVDSLGSGSISGYTLQVEDGKPFADIKDKKGNVYKRDISTLQKRKAVEEEFGFKFPFSSIKKAPGSSTTAFITVTIPDYGQNQDTTKPGATQAEMDEYNAVLKEITVVRNGKKSYKFIEGKTPRALAIYDKMNEKQKSSVEVIPPPPPLPRSSHKTGNKKYSGREIPLPPPPPPKESSMTYKTDVAYSIQMDSASFTSPHNNTNKNHTVRYTLSMKGDSASLTPSNKKAIMKYKTNMTYAMKADSVPPPPPPPHREKKQ
ncbi:MAG: M56 family metallopeptidase [Niabella sp.]